MGGQSGIVRRRIRINGVRVRGAMAPAPCMRREWHEERNEGNDKKVLILSASPRKGGNSDLLCDQFAKGTEEAGYQVEKIRVQEKRSVPA